MRAFIEGTCGLALLTLQPATGLLRAKKDCSWQKVAREQTPILTMTQLEIASIFAPNNPDILATSDDYRPWGEVTGHQSLTASTGINECLASFAGANDDFSL